ncbi:hypothetical protein AOLI_G00288160 [Acnodon oligacanthus]
MPGYTYPLEINCFNSCCSSFSTYPATVDNITVLDQNNNSVWVTWLVPLGHVDSYELNISSVALNRTCTELSNQSQIQQLLAGYIYNLIITSVSGGLRNTSSVFQFATKPNPPSTISVNGQTNVSVAIFWGAPGSMDGLSVFYEVSFKSSQSSTNTSLTNNTSIQFTALSPGNQYNIAICTIGVLGLKSSSVTIIAYTIPNAVQNLQASPVNTSSVNLAWSQLPGNSGLLSYKIQINGTFFYTSSFSLLLTQLQPGTSYNCSVTALIPAANLSGPPQYTLCITSLDKASNISAVGTSVSMRVEWSGPAGSVSLYTITLLLNRTILQTQNQSDAAPVVFSNLFPGTLYTVTLGITSGPVQVNSGSVQNATLPSPPGVIKLTQQTTNTLSISWAQPLNMSSVGYCFRVLYQCNYSNSSCNSMNTLNDSSKNSSTITGLSAGSPYIITVQTVGALGYLSSSQQIIAYTCPSSVSSVNVDSFSEHSIFLSWQQTDILSSAYSYLLTVRSPNGTSNLQLRVGSTTAQLQPLQSASLYNISIITQTADGTQSTAMNITAFTKVSTQPNLYKKQCSSKGSERDGAVVTSGRVDEANIHVDTQHRINTGDAAPICLCPHQLPLAKKRGHGAKIKGDGSDKSYRTIIEPGQCWWSWPTSDSALSQSPSRIRSHTLAMALISLLALCGSTRWTCGVGIEPLQVVSLEAKLLNVTAVWLNWKRPLEFHDGFSYRVQISNCTESSRSLLVTSENTTFTNLQPGTLCLFSVYSCSYGIEGQPVSISLYTKPFAVIPIMANNGSNSSLVVSWTQPVGHVGQYLLNISCEDMNRSVLLNNTEHTYTFTQLAAATVYTLTFVTISGPFEEASQPITMATCEYVNFTQ